MQMGGYPAKVKSLTFLFNGLLMATSGSQGAVVWPFAGSNGPMGKQASEVAFDDKGMTSRVAAARKRSAGLVGGLLTWLAGASAALACPTAVPV